MKPDVMEADTTEKPQAAKPAKPRKASALSPAECIAARRLWLYVAQDDAWVAEQLHVGKLAVKALREAGGWQRDLPGVIAERKADDAAFSAEAKQFGRQVNQRALRSALAYLELHETASGKLAAGSVDLDSGDVLDVLRRVPGLKEVTEVGRLVTGQTTNQTGIESDMAAQVEALRRVLRGDDDSGAEGGTVDGLQAAQPTEPRPSQP